MVIEIQQCKDANIVTIVNFEIVNSNTHGATPEYSNEFHL